MSERAALRQLADRLAILPGYRSIAGIDVATSDLAREALCAAMGHDASDEQRAKRALEMLEHEDHERLVQPVLVWREWEHGAPELLVEPHARGGARDYRIELELESGERQHTEGRLPESSDAHSALALPLPSKPQPGYHTVRLWLDGPGHSEGARDATQRLIVTPRQAFAPEQALGPGGRGFGVLANLYSVRGERDRGHGTLHDLATLARAAGEAGASFVGVNPLHAVGNRGLDIAPYSPSSRLFRNVLYLDPEDVPELADSPAARALLDAGPDAASRERLRAASQIDQEGVLDLLEPVLRALHATFRAHHLERDTERGRAYTRYREHEGQALIDFATWEVLAERHAKPGAARRADWWTWPAPYRDPRSEAVARFREQEAVAVDFRCWLQFELDRQLANAAAVARDSGCMLGLYQDLALGASRASADVWTGAHEMASGVNLGAPPDDYAPEGQDWGLPPFDPHRLRADGYRGWTRLLRAVFTSTGVLRVDHAMGLMRQFWIPAGRSGADGAYVAFPVNDLLGVLALESQRARAVVVAEDLGTVPPELPALLEDWGLLRSAVVHFARDEGGGFRSSAEHPQRALATFGTHDLPPFAGLWSGDDLQRERALGRIESEEALQEQRDGRAAYRTALLSRLAAEGLLEGAPPDAEAPAAVLAAVHAFLARTPCVLVAAALDDIAFEHDPVNVPGVPLERYRSWSRRMQRSLQELAASGALQNSLAPLRCGLRGAVDSAAETS